MSYTCCVVPSCMKYKGKRFIRIPYKDKDMFDTWLKQINNPKLYTYSPLHVHKSFRICTRHFEEKWFKPKNQISTGILKSRVGALPTILLTKEEEMEETLREKRNKIIYTETEKDKVNSSIPEKSNISLPEMSSEILHSEIINLNDLNIIKQFEKNRIEIPKSTADVVEVNSDNFLSILTSPYRENNPNEDLIKKSKSISKCLKSTSTPQCGKLVQLHVSHSSYDIFGITLRNSNI